MRTQVNSKVEEYIATALTTEPYERRLAAVSLKDEAEGIQSLYDRARQAGWTWLTMEMEYEKRALFFYHNIHLPGAHLRTACRIFRWELRRQA